jgi:manganese oxidase
MNATATPTAMSGMGDMMGGTPMHGMGSGTPMHHDMTGATPTPGMSMGGHDMGPVDASDAPLAPKDARGGQRLEPRLVNGIKEFNLTVQKVRWNILPNVEVVAYTYNGTVPGPEIRVTEGDHVRILVANNLKEPTTVHWHGMQIPNDQDGAADVTQPPIKPGETYTYEWTVPNTPGTFFYHTHFAVDKQQALGLYGALIVESKQPKVNYDTEYTIMLGEWTVKDGKTYPAMDMDGQLPNFFTINGRSYPSTDVIRVKVGQRVLLRFIGSGQFIHPMHLHGQPFRIVGTDGNPVPEAGQLTKDTVLLGPGERYDVEFVARAPGKWLLHCHINHHITNDGAEVNGGGGLTMVVEMMP